MTQRIAIAQALAPLEAYANDGDTPTIAEPQQKSEPEVPPPVSVAATAKASGKNQPSAESTATSLLASGIASGQRMVGAVDHAHALLAGLVFTAPSPELQWLLAGLERGQAIPLYSSA